MAVEGLSAVAVVTGASRGLGAGLARRFAGAGLRLGVCTRRAPEVPGAARDAVVSAEVDVTDADAVEDFARAVAGRFGRIDLWVNNAGVIEPIGPLAGADPAAVARAFDVNVLGVVHGTATFARHVAGRDGGGVLVNVSSGAAARPYAGWGPYCAAKAAVEQLTAVVAVEEAAHGLRAHAVAPGLVDTEMQATIRATDESRFPDVGRFRERRRFNSPAWVADHLLEIAFGDAPPPGVRVAVPDEPALGGPAVGSGR